MKLIRVGPPGSETPGLLLDDGARLDASGLTDDYTPDFLADDGIARLAAWLEENRVTAPKLDPEARLGPPIHKPSKIVCIGLNYRAHARESGMAEPTEPVVFFKSTTAVCGPHDDLIIPRGGDKTDWEVELAVVIGRRASYVAKKQAMDHVAGYMLHNDYSERAFQIERGGQWVKGKSCDTFAPLGPFFATTDEIGDPHALKLWLDVNGQRMQDSTTADMIFDIPTIVSYLSQFMTLEPGDVISTGTPEGVGFGFKPPVYLKPGDVVELGIDGLGTSKQIARAWAATKQ